MNMYLKLLLPKELALNAPNTVWRTDPLGYREGYRKVGEDRGGEGKGTMRGPPPFMDPRYAPWLWQLFPILSVSFYLSASSIAYIRNVEKTWFPVIT